MQFVPASNLESGQAGHQTTLSSVSTATHSLRNSQP